MAEHKLFDGAIPAVSTFEFHEHRERAPHLEQPVHQPRIYMAEEFILQALHALGGTASLSDLGCGDGGLLSLLKDTPGLTAWGYDFQPSNTTGWAERGVTATAVDVFGHTTSAVTFGDISVTTEVLEHLADPHAAVRRIASHSRYLIASSPWTETDVSHDECHAWAWDQHGYRALVEQGGFTVVRHETVGMFQVVLGVTG